MNLSRSVSGFRNPWVETPIFEVSNIICGNLLLCLNWLLAFGARAGAEAKVEI